MHYQVFMALWLTKAHFFKKIAVFFKLWVKKLAGKHAICTAYKSSALFKRLLKPLPVRLSGAHFCEHLRQADRARRVCLAPGHCSAPGLGNFREFFGVCEGFCGNGRGCLRIVALVRGQNFLAGNKEFVQAVAAGFH